MAVRLFFFSYVHTIASNKYNLMCERVRAHTHARASQIELIAERLTVCLHIHTLYIQSFCFSRSILHSIGLFSSSLTVVSNCISIFSGFAPLTNRNETHKHWEEKKQAEGGGGSGDRERSRSDRVPP